MFDFDPIENDRRIRDGLHAVVAHQPIEFAKERTSLIAVFDDPFTKFSSGRIILFQEHVFGLSGIVPVFIKGVPACLKIFFKFDIEDRKLTDEIFEALDTAASKQVYREIGVSQVQFAGKIITPSP